MMCLIMYVVQKNVSDKSHLHEFQMRRCRRLMDDGGQLGDVVRCADTSWKLAEQNFGFRDDTADIL